MQNEKWTDLINVPTGHTTQGIQKIKGCFSQFLLCKCSPNVGSVDNDHLFVML